MKYRMAFALLALLPAALLSPAGADGNPVELTNGFYVDPHSNSAQWVKDNPDDPDAAAIRTHIAEQPGARWFGGRVDDVGAAVTSYTTAAAKADRLPILAAYNIPDRDCGGQSSGGAASAADYRSWIDQFVGGIGDRPAVVIIEPDALPQLDCVPEDQQQTRIDLLKYAADQFAAKNTNAWAYLDAGTANWIDADDMAQRLQKVDVSKVRGFSLNTSNYYTTAESVTKGHAIDDALGTDTPFIVDTSRNGDGTNGEWCNPSGRKLGVTSQTSDDAEMLLWVKAPGDSDGDCGIGSGIAAGTFAPDLAMHLINGD